MNFQNLTLYKIRKKLNVIIWKIKKYIINFIIWKINILQFKKLLNCANNLWIMKK